MGVCHKKVYLVTLLPKKVHSETKNKSHARSPEIGQPRIVPVLDLKRADTRRSLSPVTRTQRLCNFYMERQLRATAVLIVITYDMTRGRLFIVRYIHLFQ